MGEAKSIAADMIAAARKAQAKFENSFATQEQVDEVVKTIAKTVFDNAEILAKMAVEETGMGVYEDKVNKNKGKARIIWDSLKGKKSVGVIEEDEETGIIKVAKPMGVIGAIAPSTNPIVTPMCNAMFAVKGHNAVIIAPHPSAKKATSYAIKLINENLKKINAPENLIQVMEEPSIDLSSELMKQADITIATGGMGMVKSAYSSGRPAYGVGVGNVQCIVDKVNFKEAVPKIIAGRIFDNGIICSGEQMVIVDEENFDEVVAEFKSNGAYFINDEEQRDKLRKTLFDENGVVSRKAVGKSVQEIARLAELSIPEGTKVILVEVNARGNGDVLCKEKMCPVIGIVKYDSFEDAVAIAKANLDVEGRGHSVAVHSNDDEHLKYIGQKLPVSRVLVNQICATMNGGSFNNGLAATTTLGCGSWGGNSISENLDYKHLINISRIAKPVNRRQPTDEELWG